MDIFIIIQVLTGLAYGMLLFMIATGMSIIFGLMNVVNMSHGTFYALGSYLAFTFINRHTGFWTALLLSVIAVGLFSLVIERLMLSRVYGKHYEEIMVTFGVMFIAADVIKLIWGGNPLTIPHPALFDSSISMGIIQFPSYRLFVIAIGIVLAFALWFLESRTRIGAIIRAGVDDRTMLGALGINVKLVFASVFTFGACLAAFGGVLAGPIMGMHIGVDIEILILSLVVVVIGGLGTWKGTFIAALLVGMIEILGQVYFPAFSMALVFMFMIVILLVKPTGLFGKEVAA